MCVRLSAHRQSAHSARQVWADADDWYEKAEAEGELEKLEEAERQKVLAAESAKYAPTPRDAHGGGRGRSCGH